jgi:hypothetical protein
VARVGIAHIKILKHQQLKPYGHNNLQAFQEMKILKTLKIKLNSDHAILVKAEKSNAITIIYETYHNKKS